MGTSSAEEVAGHFRVMKSGAFTTVDAVRRLVPKLGYSGIATDSWNRV
jgi:hypothetical protein